MPKSDKRRQQTTHIANDGMGTGKAYSPTAKRVEAVQPYDVPKVGKTPVLNHSNNLPMTNNKRAGFKSKVIFDK
jgi:hypothetical protein